jgi:UPF0042 nucleotide-binding protein
MRFVIITGMSGAGKSSVLKMLEDNNFFCVDNLPIELIIKFAELTYNTETDKHRSVALGIDIRSGQALQELEEVLNQMQKMKYPYEILFLDASDEILIKRYKETRRSHPLAPEGRVDEGIAAERKELEFLRLRANYILDTSYLLIRELRGEIEKIFMQNQKFNNLFVTILSFGFKYGIPKYNPAYNRPTNNTFNTNPINDGFLYLLAFLAAFLANLASFLACFFASLASFFVIGVASKATSDSF